MVFIEYVAIKFMTKWIWEKNVEEFNKMSFIVLPSSEVSGLHLWVKLALSAMFVFLPVLLCCPQKMG